MPEIPESVLVFLRERIDSVEPLELLLLLKNSPEKDWTVEELSRALSTQPDSVTARLAAFISEGLVLVKSESAGSHYRYQPKSAELDNSVCAVAEAYSKYPVRVISFIYSKPIHNIRTFQRSRD